MRVGTDIVHIPRVERLMRSEAALRRMFHPSELGSAEHLAGIIAAKEAYFKALGTKPRFLAIEVGHEKSGRPLLKTGMRHAACDLSISHDKDYAIAVVALEP